jgi:bisphosphoglycerate-independent phosphoglycerate mutase (AlkP superfamily)
MAAFLNAYPPRYFDAIASGRRIYSAIPLAVTSAGIPLKTANDLRAGKAIAADLTADGWHTHLSLTDIPRLSPQEAGKRLASLAEGSHFSFFEYWLSDYAGHSQDFRAAMSLLETIDQALGGLLENWDDHGGLILLTSDHGNLEDLSTRRHTSNPVPGLLIGAAELRERFIALARASASRRSANVASTHTGDKNNDEIQLNLTDIAPAILALLGID